MSFDEKSVISEIKTLSREQFYKFMFKLLAMEYPNLKMINGNDGYGYRSNWIDRWSMGRENFYIFEYLPYELYLQPTEIPFDNQVLRRKLQRIKENEHYSLWQDGRHLVGDAATEGVYFFSNIVGLDADFFLGYILPIYKSIMKEMDLLTFKYGKCVRPSIDVGSPISIAEYNIEFTKKALQDTKDETSYLTIEFSDNGYEVNKGVHSKYISSGVTRLSREIIYPSIVTRCEEQIALELERLLNENASEKTLQEFLATYHGIIFGNRYDQICVEVSLKYPELDIAHKNRRIDLFAHNQIIDDWELIELKKKVQLMSNSEGVKKFSSKISGAIEQLRNYYHILQQEKVKEAFKKDGIEYYDPCLKLIVGGKIDPISRAEWRRLVKTVPDINLITYDNLIAELRLR